MARPSNLSEAGRMLRNVDTSTAEGREAAQQVLDWIEEQPTVSASLRRRADRVRGELVEAAIDEVTTDWSQFYKVPIKQLEWLGDKNLAIHLGADEKLLKAVQWLDRKIGEGSEELRDRTSAEGIIRQHQQAVTQAAWPHMTAEERSEAEERLPPLGPDPSAGRPDPSGPGGFSPEQRRTAREATAGAGITTQPPVSPQGAREMGWGQFVGEQTERYTDAGFPPDAARARAEQDAQEIGLTPDRLLGVPWDHTTTDTESQQRFARQQAAGVEGGGTRGPGREPHFRDSDLQMPFGFSTERVAALQRRMVKAGLLSDQYRRGWYDDATQGAFGQLLGFANQRSVGIGRALDQLATEFSQQREDARGDAMGSFQAEPFLAPDPNALRQQARQSLMSIGRRASEISEDEISQMVSVMSGEYKRAHEVRQEAARRQHGASVAQSFALPGEEVEGADLSDLEAVDPMATFGEWFASDDGFGGEIETRETSEEVARRGQTFQQGLNQMRSMVRGGGA